jgi:unspecific monooxygenase
MRSVQQNPKDPSFVQDPYPFYARLRGLGDLVRWDDYGMVCTTSYGATNAILRDRRFGREVPAELQTPVPPHLAPFYEVEAHSMLELEPPRHTRLRALVLRAFTSRRIKALAPEITALCHQLIDAFPADDFDLLQAYARPIPVIVIARLLGVPEGLADDLLRWSNAMVAMYQAGRTRAVEDAAVTATTEFVAFMRGHIDARRSAPADDLITHLIAAEEDGERLTTDEMITTCILLLNAGHEATVHTIGNGVKTILDHGLVPRNEGCDLLVEEILRFAPPLHMFTRHAYEQIELFGHRFQRGDQVACLLASANRDPAIYADPDVFAPTRPITANTSFGGGLHFCVGAPLARLELQIALPILFQRCPGLALTAAARYADVYHFHGLKTLPVKLAEPLSI